MADETTVERGYPLPNPDNVAREDAQRIRDAIEQIDGDIHALLTDPPVAAEDDAGAVRLATETEATAGMATDAVPTIKRARDMIDALVAAAINTLKAGVDPAYDTLLEIADKLANDDTAIAGILDALAQRVRADTVAQGLDATQRANARANILAIGYDTAVSDCDLATVPGVYSADNLASNTPSADSYFALEVYRFDATNVMQRATEANTRSIFVRYRDYLGAWQPWVKILSTADVASVSDILSNVPDRVLTTDEAYDAAGWKDMGAVSGLITIDANDGIRQKFVLTGNVTVSVINVKTAIEVAFEQDATGSRTVGWDTSIKFPNGVIPTVTTTAGSVALIAVVEKSWDGVSYIANGWHL